MGFNKRIFNIDMLVDFYNKDKVNCIKNAIGKTEAFTFKDDYSSKIILLWLDGNHDKSIQILEDYVSGITS